MYNIGQARKKITDDNFEENKILQPLPNQKLKSCADGVLIILLIAISVAMASDISAITLMIYKFTNDLQWIMAVMISFKLILNCIPNVYVTDSTL